MVKPVFKARNEMRDAGSAEDAYQIGLTFLRSNDARHVKDGDAGVFAKDVVQIFNNHQAPELLISLLEASQSEDLKSHLPFGLKTSLAFQLTDVSAQNAYLIEAQRVLLQNAQILQNVIDATAKSGMSAIFSKEVEVGLYPDIKTATNGQSLQLSINKVMSEQDIPDEDASGFMSTVQAAFHALAISSDDQIEILNMIVDASSREDKLYELALESAIAVIDASESAAPNLLAIGNGRSPA